MELKPKNEESELEPKTEHVEPEPKNEEPEPEPKKPKFQLLRLPLVAFKECMLSMDLNEIIKLSLCSIFTANTLKLFKRSYFKRITNCKIEFIEDRFCGLEFSSPTFLKEYFFFDTQRGTHIIGQKHSSHSYISKIETPQTFATQFLELSDSREVELFLMQSGAAIREYALWANNHESFIKSVNLFSCEKNLFETVKEFRNWRKVVLIHQSNEFHLNHTEEKKSISIKTCEYYMQISFWKLPYQIIHFSKDAFDIYPFVGYLQKWIKSYIPCTELVDFTAELLSSNYFDKILENVKFEEVNEEWIHPIHGIILPPSYKIQRFDKRKNALLFRFQKDGELCLGMHFY